MRSAAHLLRGLKPGPLEDEISIFERRGTVQSVVRHVIVRVEHAELPCRQHVLVPTLQTCVDNYLRYIKLAVSCAYNLVFKICYY